MAQITASGNGYILYATASVGATDEANNRSRVDFDLSLRADSSPSGFSGYSPDTSLTYLTLNGTSYYPAAGQRTVNRGSTVSFLSGSVWITHTSAGVGSWSFSGRLEMQNPYPSISYMPPVMATGSGTVTSTDYVRLPAAPSSCTASIVGSDIKVDSGTATSPVTVSNYYVQYASDADAYATWSSAQVMSSRSYTYTSLVRGRTYKFRTYAVSSEGSGPSTVSSTLFYPAGGKRWDGTAFVATATAKRWDGTAFVQLTTAKRYDGTSWVNLS